MEEQMVPVKEPLKYQLQNLSYKQYKINIDAIKSIEDIKSVIRVLNFSLFTYDNTDMQKEIDLNKELFIEMKEKQNGQENTLRRLWYQYH